MTKYRKRVSVLLGRETFFNNFIIIYKFYGLTPIATEIVWKNDK